MLPYRQRSDPTFFVKLRAVTGITVATALLAPVDPIAIAALRLAGFSTIVLELYLCIQACGAGSAEVRSPLRMARSCRRRLDARDSQRLTHRRARSPAKALKLPGELRKGNHAEGREVVVQR